MNNFHNTELRFQIPKLLFPKEATILASYNCTASCKHCCFDSHPGITERLSLEKIKNFINRASKIKTIGLIVFSGGECFLLGKDLDLAIEYATKLGLATRCVTNGYWAIDSGSAHHRLNGLKKAGLKEINFSTGDFHQKYVSENNIINGAIESVNLGISTVIVIESQKDRNVTRNKLKEDPRIDKLLQQKNIFKIIESPWMPMSLEEEIKYKSEKYLWKHNLYKRTGCNSIFNNIVATPSGKMGICCGLSRELIPELNFENDDNSSIEDTYTMACNDLMKLWLFVEGPEKIIAWAATKDPTIEWEGKYSHHCHACLALYKDEKIGKVIKKYYEEKTDEILMKLYLLKNKL